MPQVFTDVCARSAHQTRNSDVKKALISTNVDVVLPRFQRNLPQNRRKTRPISRHPQRQSMANLPLRLKQFFKTSCAPNVQLRRRNDAILARFRRDFNEFRRKINAKIGPHRRGRSKRSAQTFLRVYNNFYAPSAHEKRNHDAKNRSNSTKFDAVLPRFQRISPQNRRKKLVISRRPTQKSPVNFAAGPY